jgi:hypothetical protein
VVQTQVRALIRALKLGYTVIMLDMDTSPNAVALNVTQRLPTVDIVYAA